MTRDQVFAEAAKVGQRIIDEIGVRIPPLDHQLFNTALDELVVRGDLMPEETRDLLIAFIGVFMVRQRLSVAASEHGDSMPPEAFGMIDRSNPQ